MPRTEFETQEFYDYARIVDPSIPQMLQFAEQMANLSRRLLGKYYDPAKHDFRFLLSDEADANAFTIPKSKPPIVVLTRGLLQGAKTLDEIAGVLGHELGHIMAEQVFGDLKVGNSKAEEMGADLWAVHLLTEAGFDPKGLQDFLTRLPQDSDFETRIMLALTDVHPLTHNRASAMEKARIALARQGFNVEHPSSPVPQALLDILHHLPFEYSEHSPVSVERRASYEGLSTTDQLERVVAEMQRVRDMAIPEAFKVEYGKHLISDILDRIAVNESEVNLNGVAKTMSRLSNIVEKIGGATAYAGSPEQ